MSVEEQLGAEGTDLPTCPFCGSLIEERLSGGLYHQEQAMIDSDCPLAGWGFTEKEWRMRPKGWEAKHAGGEPVINIAGHEASIEIAHLRATLVERTSRLKDLHGVISDLIGSGR
jgi:hypothetical protein